MTSSQSKRKEDDALAFKPATMTLHLDMDSMNWTEEKVRSLTQMREEIKNITMGLKTHMCSICLCPFPCKKGKGLTTHQENCGCFVLPHGDTTCYYCDECAEEGYEPSDSSDEESRKNKKNIGMKCVTKMFHKNIDEIMLRFMGSN